MSADTTGDLPDLPTEPEPSTTPQPTYGGEPEPDPEPREHTTEPDEVTGVLGLGGDTIAVPSGVWFAETDGNGGLLRDAGGNVVRTRSPHRPPRSPLGPPVG